MAVTQVGGYRPEVSCEYRDSACPIRMLTIRMTGDISRGQLFNPGLPGK